MASLVSLFAEKLNLGNQEHRLPQEVLEHVIDHLSEDCSALKSCSLVCSSLLCRARIHLFRKITLFGPKFGYSTHIGDDAPLLADDSTPRNSCHAFHLFLSSSPHFTQIVRSITIDGFELDTRNNPEPTIPLVLTSLPLLERLTIRRLHYWDQLTCAMKEVFALPSMKAIELHGIIDSNYLQAVGANVKSLVLHGQCFFDRDLGIVRCVGREGRSEVKRKEDTEVDVVHLDSLSMTDLSVDSWSVDYVVSKNFMWPQSRLRLDTLRTLHLVIGSRETLYIRSLLRACSETIEILYLDDPSGVLTVVDLSDFGELRTLILRSEHPEPDWWRDTLASVSLGLESLRLVLMKQQDLKSEVWTEVIRSFIAGRVPVLRSLSLCVNGGINEECFQLRIPVDGVWPYKPTPRVCEGPYHKDCTDLDVDRIRTVV